MTVLAYSQLLPHCHSFPVLTARQLRCGRNILFAATVYCYCRLHMHIHSSVRTQLEG